MVCYGVDWNDSLGIPTSEPPPPYSPPRKTSLSVFRHFGSPVVGGIGKNLKSALNHGPSSAFAPPPPRLNKECQPPPYCSLPLYRIQSPTRQEHNNGKSHRANDSSSSCRSTLSPTNTGATRGGTHATKGRSGRVVVDYGGKTPPDNYHPKGPVLRIGKSLEIPKSTPIKDYHHAQRVTSHRHPNDAYPKSPSIKQSFHLGGEDGLMKPKLAYIGIASKVDKVKSKSKCEKESSKKSSRDSNNKRSKSQERAGRNNNNNRCDRQEEPRKDQQSRRPLKLNFPESMLAARARPAHAVFVPDHHPRSPSAHVISRLEEDLQSLPDVLETEGKGRLRSCRSLDELSDLLEEESNSLRFGSRSLDDLMEPLYENVSFFRNPPPSDKKKKNGGSPVVHERSRHRSHSSVLDAPEVPPKLKRADQDAGDIRFQLEKLKEIARVLGVKIQRGELSTSSSLSRSSCTENQSMLRSAFALIDDTLHTSMRSPTQRIVVVPGVPVRAPVINDVSQVLGGGGSGGSSSSTKSCSPQSQEVSVSFSSAARDHQFHHHRRLSEECSSPSSRSPETDCGSQESGYNSVDSRSYIAKHKRDTTADQSASSCSGDSSAIRSSSLNQRQPPPVLHPYNQRDCSSYQIKDHLRLPMRAPPFGVVQSEPLSLPCINGTQSYAVLKTAAAPQLNKSLSPKARSPPSSRATVPPKPARRSERLLVDVAHHSKGENQDQLGIYIKSVVAGGAADQDGRLQASDQLLSVDGKSLVGISQEDAAEYMVRTGPIVTLEVARQGALYHGLAPVLMQPSPQVNNNNRGIQDARREPNPVQHFNHNNPQPYQHPSMQSRMQPSKSVPSLNSETTNVVNKVAPPENFGHSYSRTSSATSLSHNHQYPMRSKSTQNLNEGGPLTLSARHPSSPSLNNEDDRHYQNVSFHQGSQDPRMGSQRGARPPIFAANAGGHDQRPVSAFMHREDPSQQVDAIHRPTSQQNIRQDPRLEDPRKRDERIRFNGHQVAHSGPVGSGPGFPHGPPQAGSNPNLFMRPQIRGGPSKFGIAYSSQMSPHGPPPGQMSPQGPTPGQMSPHGPPPGQMSPHGPPPGQMSPHGPPPGQMSPHGPPPGQLSPHGPPPGQMSPVGPPGQFPHHGFYPQSVVGNVPPQMSPQYANSPQGRNAPHTAPKPNRGSGSYDAPEKPSRMDGFKTNGPPRPPLPEDGIRRESPPPPPPPTSTHPLLQTTKDGSAASEDARKRQTAQRWRDERITSLENLEKKTPQEEERMNTLRLEREFQKRAEAARLEEGDEDDEEDEDDEIDERPEVNHHWSTQDGNRKADEIRRKQEELEAAKEAEERILREAQRRQDEEIRHRHRASQRLDTLLGDSEQYNGTSPLPPERGSSYNVMHHQSLESKNGPSVKRVQFSENSNNNVYDTNANHEKMLVREDPNVFINEAESMFNSSPNRSGDTPGVIGAQEVYRDPRQRRLLEQAQKAEATRNPGPEKLTFREKMKMFAMEAEDSPKD